MPVAAGYAYAVVYKPEELQLENPISYILQTLQTCLLTHKTTITASSILDKTTAPVSVFHRLSINFELLIFIPTFVLGIGGKITGSAEQAYSKLSGAGTYLPIFSFKRCLFTYL